MTRLTPFLKLEDPPQGAYEPGVPEWSTSAVLRAFYPSCGFDGCKFPANYTIVGKQFKPQMHLCWGHTYHVFYRLKTPLTGWVYRKPRLKKSTARFVDCCPEPTS